MINAPPATTTTAKPIPIGNPYWSMKLSSSSSPFGGIGSSPRRAATPVTNQAGQSYSKNQQQQQQIQKQQQQATKEVMDSFLTRDSRNTFIGMYDV